MQPLQQRFVYSRLCGNVKGCDRLYKGAYKLLDL
jgi:hypothetical protein